jgi:hypothetical protein
MQYLISVPPLSEWYMYRLRNQIVFFHVKVFCNGMIRPEIDIYPESHEDGLLPFLHLLLFGMNILYSQLLLIVLATS